MMKVKPILC